MREDPNIMTPANLLEYDLDGLAAFCEKLGEKRFRATQLFRWIHQKGAADFTAMSDLAKSLRDKLAGVAQVRALGVSYDVTARKRAELEAVAQELLKKEIIYKDDLERLVGKRPFEDKHHEEDDSKPHIAGPDNAPLNPGISQNPLDNDVTGPSPDLHQPDADAEPTS